MQNHSKTEAQGRQTEVVRRDRYVPTGRQEEFIVPLLRGEIERILGQFVTESTRGMAVLDVGCGRQPFRTYIESHGLRYVGLDVEQNQEGTVDVVCRIDQPLPEVLLEKGPFDFVICTEVLEHVAFWTDAFKNLAQLVRPGGTCLITCPFFYHLHEEPYDFWRPTLHCLRAHAGEHGFTVESEQRAGSFFDVLGTLIGNFGCYPAKETLVSRLATKLTGKAVGLLFRVLKSRWLAREVRTETQVYLSNIVVLKKKA